MFWNFRRLWLIAIILGSSVHAVPAFAAFNTGSNASVATFSAFTLLPTSTLLVDPNGQKFNCKVTLSWTQPQPGIPTNWIIQRYVGANTSGSARTVAGTDTSYVDSSNISLGTTYTWRIYSRMGATWTSTTTTSAAESISNSCN